MPPALPNAPADQAYVSIVDWPKGFTLERGVETLVAATGLDPHTARLRCARRPPIVVARVDASVGEDVVRVLHKAGVTAFAPTDAQMEAVPSPVRAKRLEAAAGAPEPMYRCEPWRGEPVGFLARDIFLLVRARLARQVRTAVKVQTEYTYPGYGPVATSQSRKRETTSALSDVFDVYLADGRRVRVDGDKFNWDVLGRDKGVSDNLNADRLCLRLAAEAPRAIVDTAFGGFHAPEGLIGTMRVRSRSDGHTVRDDHPVFEFYSVWAWLLYQRLLRG